MLIMSEIQSPPFFIALKKTISETEHDKIIWNHIETRDFNIVSTIILGETVRIFHNKKTDKLNAQLDIEENSFNFPNSCDSLVKQLYETASIKEELIPTDLNQFINNYIKLN